MFNFNSTQIKIPIESIVATAKLIYEKGDLEKLEIGFGSGCGVIIFTLSIVVIIIIHYYKKSKVVLKSIESKNNVLTELLTIKTIEIEKNVIHEKENIPNANISFGSITTSNFSEQIESIPKLDLIILGGL